MADVLEYLDRYSGLLADAEFKMAQMSRIRAPLPAGDGIHPDEVLYKLVKLQGDINSLILHEIDALKTGGAPPSG